MRLVGRNQLRYRAIIHQYLDHRASSTPVRCLDQHLSNNGLQAHRQKHYRQIQAPRNATLFLFLQLIDDRPQPQQNHTAHEEHRRRHRQYEGHD